MNQTSDFALAEYKTLRSQLSAQYQWSYNLTIFVVTANSALFAWLLNDGDNEKYKLYVQIFGVSLTLFGLLMYWISQRSSQILIDYIRGLEVRLSGGGNYFTRHHDEVSRTFWIGNKIVLSGIYIFFLSIWLILPLMTK